MSPVIRAGAVLVLGGWLGLLAGSACSPFHRPCVCPVPAPLQPGRFTVTEASWPELAGATVEATAERVLIRYPAGVIELAVDDRYPPE